MAGVVRLSSGRLVQKYFCNFSSQVIQRHFKLKQRICFHTSPFLNVLGQEISMPSLSPTMTEGTIVQWLKKEGDVVAPGDVLCEIQTDKAVMAFETEEEGILAKILVEDRYVKNETFPIYSVHTKCPFPPIKSLDLFYPNFLSVSSSRFPSLLQVGPGSKDIKVGTLIALMVAEGEDWKSVEMAAGGGKPTGEGGPSSSASGGSAGQGSSSSSGAASGGTVPGNEVTMPALSPTMTDGTIVAWKKKEGDKLSPGDALCEIQTDKAVMTFEIEEEGILAKILVPDGTANVKVGTLIAVTVDEGADWKQVKIPSTSGVAAAAGPTPVEEKPAFTGGNVPGLEVKMPSLSPTMTEGQIVNWVKKEGDKLSPGDVLCEIQTDKAVMAYETEEEGILAKILAPAGSGAIKVGSLIALSVEEGQDWKDVAIPTATGPAVPTESKPPPPPSAPTTPAAAAVPSGYHLVGDFAPSVRAWLERYQLTGKEVTPTGRNKRMLKGDVLKYIADKGLQPKAPVPVPVPGQKAGAPSGAPGVAPSTAAGTSAVTGRLRKGFTDVEISSMRRTIANRLTQSKTEIPHAYSTLQAEIDDLLRARKQLQNLGVKVSVNDFIVKAVASALRQCSYANTLFVKDQITLSPTIDVSIAVATPNGLITPIIKNADQKSVDAIAAEVRQLAAKAREGKLQLHEFQGGSFTISNLGMFGITEFSAIINPPQCGILAVGGGRPTVKPDGSAATVMCATLSYDARAMTDDEVAAFMEVLTGFIESPASLLMSASKKPPRVVSKAVSLDFL